MAAAICSAGGGFPDAEGAVKVCSVFWVIVMVSTMRSTGVCRSGPERSVNCRSALSVAEKVRFHVLERVGQFAQGFGEFRLVLFVTKHLLHDFQRFGASRRMSRTSRWASALRMSSTRSAAAPSCLLAAVKASPVF